MMDTLYNPWFVTIVGGILVTLLCALLKYIFKAIKYSDKSSLNYFFQLIGLIVTIIFIIFSLYSILTSITNLFPKPLAPAEPEQIEVPHLYDKSYEEAEEILHEVGLVINKQSSENHSAITEGHIISQSPDYGTLAQEGTVINVNVSLGPPPTDEKVIVPSLYNKSYEEAQKILQESGLKIQIRSSVNHSIIKKGNIISQTPYYNMDVLKDTVVKVTVSLGPPPPSATTKTFTMPDIIRKSYADAESALKDYNVTFEITSRQNSNDIPEGGIIKSTPSSGDSVNYGSKIYVDVSSGPSKKVENGSDVEPWINTSGITSTLDNLELRYGSSPNQTLNLIPAFDKYTTNYTVNVDGSVAQIAFKPTTSDSSAIIRIMDCTETSGQWTSYSVILSGSNNFNIIVTAGDGKTVTVYTVKVERT